jgi:hypothetical protein
MQWKINSCSLPGLNVNVQRKIASISRGVSDKPLVGSNPSMNHPMMDT